MNEDQKIPLHPIVERALEMAYEGFEPIDFDDYAVEQLQDLLGKYSEEQELVKAVVELLRLSVVLDKQGCKSASVKILIVVSSAADALEKFKKEKDSGTE